VVKQHLKLSNAQQVEVTQADKNTKEKWHRTNAAICLKKCADQTILTPNYIQIKINGKKKKKKIV
jgi:hypothetical protein